MPTISSFDVEHAVGTTLLIIGGTAVVVAAALVLPGLVVITFRTIGYRIRTRRARSSR